MADGFLLYVRLSWQSVRAQLAYRVSFIALFLGNFMVTSMEFVGTWFLFQRFHQLGGYSVGDVAVLYGVASLSMSLPDVSASGFDQCGTLIRRGDFDRLLLRPRAIALQLLGRELALRRFGRVAQAALVLAWGIHKTQLALSFTHCALLAFAILGGICVFIGIGLLSASLSFWTLQSLELIAILSFGGLETAQYPVHIYDRWLRNLFLFGVPIATATYFPVGFVLGKPDPFHLPDIVRLSTPLAGPLFLLGMLFIWRLALRRYASTGS